MLSKIKKKNKKAISLMISYVLLVSMAVIMGILVYKYIKTFVPTDVPECPDGTSLMILDKTCDGTDLQLTIKNNGRFNVTGFFIYATEPGGELATINLMEGQDPGYYLFLQDLEPEQENNPTISLTEFSLGNSFKIKIVPVKQVLDKKKILRATSCDNAAITEEITCSL